MLALRLLLSLIFVVVASYTGVVISRHGIDLLPVFFGDMAKMGWAGQFNLDFMFMLLFSALWVAWRHHFSAAGLALALLALFGGTPFLCVYLLIESTRSGSDVRALQYGLRRNHRAVLSCTKCPPWATSIGSGQPRMPWRSCPMRAGANTGSCAPTTIIERPVSNSA